MNIKFKNKIKLLSFIFIGVLSLSNISYASTSSVSDNQLQLAMKSMNKEVKLVMVGKGTGDTVDKAVGEALSELINNSNFSNIFEEINKKHDRIKEGDIKIVVTVKNLHGKDTFTAYASRKFVFLLKDVFTK